MTPLVTVELICAIFVAALIVRQFREHNASKSAVWLRIDTAAMLCWLLIDAGAYLTELQYVLTLLAYTMGNIVLFIFLGYVGAYIEEKAGLRRRVFLVPQILALLCAAGAAAAFLAGKIVVYENGAAVAINPVPAVISVFQIGLIVFSVAVAVLKGRLLGWKSVILFAIFGFSAVFGSVTALFLGADYTVAFSAVALMIIVAFLQGPRKAGFRPETTFAGVTVLIILLMIIQSGVFSREPVIVAKPDNCYGETLRVVTDENYLPYSFYDDEGNESGHDVELIIMLANEMHMDLDLRFVPWNTGIRELAEGRADVLLTCDYYDDLGGAEGVLMTEPVTTDDFVVYSKTKIRHIDELYDKKIAVMENANCLPYIEMYHLDGNCIFTENNSDAINAVENGSADCAVLRHTVAEAILKGAGYPDISSRITIGSSFTCFGVGQENAELLARLNGALETLKRNGTLQELDRKWLTTFVHTYSVKETLSNNPWLIALAALLLVFGALSFVRAKQKRAKELADNNARLFTLQDNFISLYDVNLESGEYVSYDRGDFYQSNIRDKLVSSTRFFENMRENIDRVVCEEYRDEVFKIQQKEAIIKGLSENDHIDLYYKLITDKGPMWTKMRIVYKNAGKKNVILGIFDASEEMAAREHAEHARTEQLARSAGNVSSYIINPKTGRFNIFRQDAYLAGKYTPDEDFASSFPRYIETDVAEEDRALLRKAVTIPAMTEHLAHEDEYTVTFRDISAGYPRWYELRAVRLSDEEILLSFSDVNEEHVRQIVFDKLQEGFFAFFCADLKTDKAIRIKDDPGVLFGDARILPYSALIGKLAGTAEGEAGETIAKLGDSEYLGRRFASEDKAEYIYPSDLSGEHHWIDLTQLVLERNADGLPSVIAIGFNYLDQEAGNVQEMQLKIAEQQEQLTEALAMADSANRAKTDFLFNMSHDIRTPMNAIIGFTNMARRDIGNPRKALDSLEKVQLSSEILLNLINDVLDMSRIESGKVELHEEKYALTEAFDSFEPAMSSLAAAKDIDLKFSIGAIRNRYVFADGPRFDRVLINIISNAIKYTPAGGFVKVSADQIADTEPGYGNYRFTVADSGIGMSEEFQKHMFENFSREENSTTRGVQGTGLGLSLAKKLTDMMGGTISCVSTQGIGTTFTMVFPFRLQTEEDISREAAVEQEFRALDLHGMKVLLVEDNELNREIAEELLSDEGITVETAVDGQKAVNRVRERGAEYYDFILMDIQMPVMDGYEAVRAIRRLIPDLKAPIIALSANAFAEDKQKSLEAGMDDHVAKPVSIRELMNALARLL